MPRVDVCARAVPRHRFCRPLPRDAQGRSRYCEGEAGVRGREPHAPWRDPHSPPPPPHTPCVTPQLDACGPKHLSLTRHAISSAPTSSCWKIFQRWGAHLSSLTLLRSPVADRTSLPTLLGLTTRLKKLHITDPDPSGFDDVRVATAILSLVHLEELRLHITDVMNYDASPFTMLLMGMAGDTLPAPSALGPGVALGSGGGAAAAATPTPADASDTGSASPPPAQPVSLAVRALRVAHTGGAASDEDSSKPMPLVYLRNIMLSSRLDARGTDALSRYIGDGKRRSQRLVKLKVSTALVSSPGGLEVLEAVARHPALRKLTVLRPEGLGEPIRKLHCAVIARVMVACKTLQSVHIRRAGMWTDTLAALQPPKDAPNITCLKLDSNSLAYLSGAFFNESMESLLVRLPNVRALHLGNNQIDKEQAVALAATIKKCRLNALTSLTLGSNDIGDKGLEAILNSLPDGIEQLYLHGTAVTDEGAKILKTHVGRFTKLWGLGLNGNPITDVGVAELCLALQHKERLQDIGITLSDMTDHGCSLLGASLHTCTNLRFVYLYSSGFKAASKITDAGKEELRKMLPAFATPAFDHKLSRYLKTP